MSEYVVELQNVTKIFPGVKALSNMELHIKPGEIHGLIGENGAGKSTLIKCLTGVHAADEGSVLVDGVVQHFRNPNDSAKAGIACVYQELNIEKLLSVTDNIFINKWIKGGAGLLDYPAMHKKAYEVMKSLGQEVDVRKPAGSFGMGVQQMIEIAKAVLIDAKCIIMDEPTSSLSENEVGQLMRTCRELKSRGIAILFVSHKLEELFELCDCVTVIRDGQYIEWREIDKWDNDSLIQAMVGRSLENQFPKEYGTRSKEPMLKAEHLNEIGVLDDVSFEAYGGEILGFSGLVGAGRTETMRAVFGADKLDSGKIYVKGKEVNIKSPKDAIALSANEKNKDDLSIKCSSLDEAVVQLSGGNQQKVVIAKWVNTDADIYIFDEPTRGIDVGAKVDVYRVMNRLVKQGKCVILISSEMPEVLGMCDRVVVMREGRVTGMIDRNEDAFNQEDIMKCAWEV